MSGTGDKAPITSGKRDNQWLPTRRQTELVWSTGDLGLGTGFFFVLSLRGSHSVPTRCPGTDLDTHLAPSWPLRRS